MLVHGFVHSLNERATIWLSLHEALSMHGDSYSKPTYLHVDIDGQEFVLVPQLVSLRAPMLGLHFYTHNLSDIVNALIAFHVAGYSLLPQEPTRTIKNKLGVVIDTDDSYTAGHDYELLPGQSHLHVRLALLFDKEE